MKTKYFFVLIIALIISFEFLNAQKLSDKQENYIKNNVSSISIDENYENGNWNIVLGKVKNKRIVLLGELNHGSRENFLVRNDLIKSLHEKANFNVILFEAGIGEVYVVNFHKKRLSPKVMTNSLIGQWQTEEFENLMIYIKSRDINIGGFDVQRGYGGFFNQLFENEASKKHVDTVLYNTLERKFGVLKKKLTNRRTFYDSIQPKTNQLIRDYQNIYNLLNRDNHSKKKPGLLITLKTLENRMNYLNYLLEWTNYKDYNKRWEARDYYMANNISWLLENVYRNDKVIVIAHNFHVSKFNKKENVMGEFLLTKYENHMYSIGTFIGSGTYFESEKEKIFGPADIKKLDVKHIINTLKDPVHFINIPKKRKSENNWLFKEIVVNESFINLNRDNRLKLSKWFDGLIFIDKSSVPKK